jgi:translation elongation factor EF-G
MTPKPPSDHHFRESIRIASIGERKYVRYFDGRGHFAHLRLELAPDDGSSVTILRGEGLGIPDSCCGAAETALKEATRHGSLRGFPCCGFSIRITGGTYLAPYSYPEAFANVARMALEDGLLRGMRVVVEPWCEIVLRTPGHWLEGLSRKLHQLLGETTLDLRTGLSTFEMTLSLPARAWLLFTKSFPSEAIEVLSTRPHRPHYRPVLQLPGLSLPEEGPFQDWS